MEIHRVHFVVRVPQILEVRQHFPGVQAAFEVLRASGKGQRVKTVKLGHRVGDSLDLQQHGVNATVECCAAQVFGRLKDPLTDWQLVLGRARTDLGIIDLYLARGEYRKTPFLQRGFDKLHSARVLLGVCWHEKVANAKRAKFELATGILGKKLLRQVYRDTCTVAHTFRRHAAAMGHGAKCLVSFDQQIVCLFSVFPREESYSTGALFQRSVIKNGRRRHVSHGRCPLAAVKPVKAMRVLALAVV